jgi:hypothetical protein
MILVVGGSVNAADPVTPDQLRDVLVSQQRFYEQSFPDLRFVLLEGASAPAREIEALVDLLGREPSSLDYEHPAELRALLTEVSLERIRLMLRHQIPSASLFRPDPTTAEAEDVCVITLSRCMITSDAYGAIGSMLDLPDKALSQIPEAIRRECAAYLMFAFDHEAYHCLSSLYDGPQPMSFEDLWGEYWHFRSEQGADAYAMARHLQRHGGRTHFADEIRRLRGTSLYDGDIDHWTGTALDHVLDLPPKELADASASELLGKARRIRDALAPDYPSYLAYRRAAIEAMRALGVEASVIEASAHLLPEGPVDPMLVRMLTEESRRYAEVPP